MFKFERIEAKDKESLGGLLNKFGLSFSDHCFGGLYIWSDTYHTEFAVENDTVIIRGKLDGKRFYQAPVGKNFECAVNFLIENDPGNLRFLSISKEEKQRIEEAFPGKFQFVYDRDNSDYIYSREELESFQGKKFQQKRNHINRFIRQYGMPEIVPLNTENVAMISEAECRWLHENGPDDKWLRYENMAIKRCIEHFDMLGFIGVALKVQGEIVAFGIGERLGRGTILQHFEKATRKLDGCYTIMTREFAKALPEDIQYINREEDMGIEGLRKSKLSLKPIKLEDKYDGWLVK